MNRISAVEASFKKELPQFSPGDTLKIYLKVKEGEKERIQAFQGVVIAKRGSGTRETLTVRKISYGVGVERIIPACSPLIDKIEVLKRGRVRRAKLYYLRHKKGKDAKVKEKEFFGKKTKVSAH